MLTDGVITLLSSDEEEKPTKKKRLKLVSLPLEKPTVLKDLHISETEPCIILSDDDSPIAEDIPSLIPAPTSVDEFEKETPNCAVKEENGTCTYNDTNESVICELFNKFLNKCVEYTKVSEHRNTIKEKLEFMKDAFDKYMQHTDDFSQFQQNLEYNLENLENQPKRSVIYFSDVYQLLKVNLRDVTEAKEAIAGKQKIIRKLERTIAKLNKQIVKLDNSVCNFEDEENSTYMQVARYKQRVTKIHNKLCKYRKINPNAGRISHQRLKLTLSNNPTINEVITKKFKNSTVFPTYHMVETLIRNCVKEDSMNSLSDVDIKIEAKQCFEKLGNYIQRQRKRDLYSMHSDYLIEANDDPAKDNPELQGKLLQSYQIKVEEENKVFEKFSAMQEKGVKCEDSEEASVADSESDQENDKNEANEKNRNDPIESEDVECITID